MHTFHLQWCPAFFACRTSWHGLSWICIYWWHVFCVCAFLSLWLWTRPTLQRPQNTSPKCRCDPLPLVALDDSEGIQPEKLHDQTWGFVKKKPLLPITSKIGWTIYGLVFFGILHFWRFAVGSVSCSPSTRQLLKIRWPFRRAVNYGFCSSSGKASGIAVAERWSKEKDPWEAQEPDWRLRTCKVYESVGSSTDRMHESCESTLSPAEHLINSLSPSTLTLSNVNPFLLGHYDKRYQGQTSWHHTVRLLTLLGGHLTYLEGGGSNSISLTASAPIEVKEQAASVSREPWAVAILRCFEETWLKDESMK